MQIFLRLFCKSLLKLQSTIWKVWMSTAACIITLPWNAFFHSKMSSLFVWSFKIHCKGLIMCLSKLRIKDQNESNFQREFFWKDNLKQKLVLANYKCSYTLLFPLLWFIPFDSCWYDIDKWSFNKRFLNFWSICSKFFFHALLYHSQDKFNQCLHLKLQSKGM